MREEIRIGLENLKQWNDTLAIKDPIEKNRALVKYLLKSTAPKNDKGTYLYYASEPLLKLGKTAIPVLVELLDNAEANDNLNEAMRILYLFGDEAKPAFPVLCRLLDNSSRVGAVSIIGVLQMLNDSNALPHIRPALKAADYATAVRAAQALAYFKDVESFDNMAALVPAEPKSDNAYLVRDLLNALYDLDPEKAKPIVKKAAKSPNMEKERRKLKALDYYLFD